MPYQGIEARPSRHNRAESASLMLGNMAPPWKTFQRFLDVTENLVFNEAPKFIRQIQRSDTLQRGIQQGIKFGLDAIAGSSNDEAPALKAGRPITDNSVPTAQRARRLVYAPDLDGRADPGEIVWTWVVYEDDPTRGKDRQCWWWAVTAPRCSGSCCPARTVTNPTAPGSGSAAATGTTRAGRAGSGWTGCSTFPRRASDARARSATATPSRWSPRDCGLSTRGAD